jgi:hypothetical protein
MFKLILHHTYKMQGEAVDLSRNNNHGFRTAVTYASDGITPDSGALAFAGGPSRVWVRDKPVWQNLRAVKIDMWVKLTALGQRRNLVEGDCSFAFFVNTDGVLWGTFLGSETPGAAPTWHGANSDIGYSPDGVRHTVPLNSWTKLTYLHDGIASLRLYIDDTLVGANYSLQSPVPSVQSAGVHIGHWPPNDDRYSFNGEIDEVKIWKYDPDVAYKQFFCRPMKARQMAAWEQVFDNIAARLADRELREPFIACMRCMRAAQEDLMRAIRSQGEDAIKRSTELNRQYRAIWCSGAIDSPEMQAFLEGWLGWLNELLGEQWLAEYGKRIAECLAQCDALGLHDLAPQGMAASDPTFAGYLGMIEKLTPALQSL